MLATNLRPIVSSVTAFWIGQSAHGLLGFNSWFQFRNVFSAGIAAHSNAS